MRILCKHKDYYDYLQYEYNDYSLTFDRRNCEYVKEDIFIKSLKSVVLKDTMFKMIYNYNEIFDLYLLKIGYCNWIIKNKLISDNENSIELLYSFKDYDNKILIFFDCIRLSDLAVELRIRRNGSLDKDLFEFVIKNKQYKHSRDFYGKSPITGLENKLPLFTNTKIPSLIPPQDMYLAFEEYFSSLKDEIVTDNMTDKDKIVSHGFDTKNSFRNVK